MKMKLSTFLAFGLSFIALMLASCSSGFSSQKFSSQLSAQLRSLVTAKITGDSHVTYTLHFASQGPSSRYAVYLRMRDGKRKKLFTVTGAENELYQSSILDIKPIFDVRDLKADTWAAASVSEFSYGSFIFRDLGGTVLKSGLDHWAIRYNRFFTIESATQKDGAKAPTQGQKDFIDSLSFDAIISLSLDNQPLTLPEEQLISAINVWQVSNQAPKQDLSEMGTYLNSRSTSSQSAPVAALIPEGKKVDSASLKVSLVSLARSLKEPARSHLLRAVTVS